MIPVAASSVRPFGRFVAPYVIGCVPVTGILYSTSWPGVTPVSDGPLMRGAGPGFGVSTSRGSTGMSSATGAAHRSR